MKKTKLMLGDNIKSLQKLPDNSIDSIVTDPPYGLSFMGKKWDYDVPSVEFWKEVLRVLKPGGHVLSFGGTRTYHRMVVNIEDAGFEIRDQIMWLYGSGFPKSHNIGKAVDKLQGNEREWVCESPYKASDEAERRSAGASQNGRTTHPDITKGNSEWEGWGTALKPANEPICVARKPLSEKSVAENVLRWGTGGINIDGCRVGTEGGTMKVDINKDSDTMFEGGRHNSGMVAELNEGRFPANIILECLCDEVIKGEKGEVKRSGSRDRTKHDYNSVGNFGSKEGAAPDNYNDKGDIHTNPMCPCRLMDEQSGVSDYSKKKDGKPGGKTFGGGNKNYEYNDKGGASRYFQQIKGGGTEDFFIYKENNIILWNIKSLTTQEYNTEENIEASDALKQARESICQKPELYGNNTTAQYLMTTISITKMKTNSIMNLTILNAYTKTTIGNFTLMIDEKQSHLLTEENILNVQIVSNQNALVSSIKTNQEVLVPIVSYVLEENLKSGETIIENTITNTTENIKSDRFFYQAKVSKQERNMGLDEFEEQEMPHGAQDKCGKCNKQFLAPKNSQCVCEEPERLNAKKKNTHPTIKPVALMAYLVRLVTPPNGIVFDPFMGSGSTGIAAQLEGFRFCGMEMDGDYFKIAEARIENYEQYKKFIK